MAKGKQELALAVSETVVHGRPDSFEALQDAIQRHFDGLSRRLQQVAEFALTHPDDIALETIAVIANQAQVPPSSLIRFAKALGFEGFTEMQRLFRARLVERTPSYAERIRGLRAQHGAAQGLVPAVVLDDFITASIDGLERLRCDLPTRRLEQGVDLLCKARSIYIAAYRRAFPVATYLAYLLSRFERRVHLLDGVGGMLEQQAQGMQPDDVLVAVSFKAYAEPVVALAERCHVRGTPILAITDGPLSPLVRLADVSLEVVDAEIQGMRCLTAPMCLALTLSVALGNRLADSP